MSAAPAWGVKQKKTVENSIILQKKPFVSSRNFV